MNRTKIKSKLVFGDRLAFNRTRESVRRKKQESLLEVSTLGNFIKRGAVTLGNTARGFLGRIMDFLGTLLLGWLLNNLPTIISMAQELMGRIQRLVSILGGFVTNIGRSLLSFGNVLGAVAQNIASFDFFDTSKRVEYAMNDLNSVFDDMSKQINDGMKLFTTPLTEGMITGEDAAPFGTDYTTQPGAEGNQPSSPGGKFTGSGVSKGAQIARRLQKDLGLTDYQAAAVVGNLLNESSQLNPAQVQNGGSGLLKVDGKTGYGWAQWTDAGRQRKLYALAQKMGIDPSKQPLTDEVNYAMLVSELPTYDSGGRFRKSRSLQEASNWLLTQYFRPADQGPGEQRERIEDSQKVLKSIKTSSTQSLPTQRSIQPSSQVSTSVVDQFKGKPGGSAGIITSERGMRLSPTTGRYKMHHGIDIAPAGPGYYVAFKQSGTVSDVSLGYSGGYGNYVDIKSGNTIYRFAHLAKVMVKRGQSYNGQTIGEIGSTGGSTGIHLHFEVRPGGGNSIDPRPYLGLLSIGKQLTGMSGQPIAISTPTPARIATQPQRRQQLPGQLTPQRMGQQIVVIDDVQPQQPPMQQAPSGGSQMMPFPTANPLNSFIKTKLLLDLAYT